MGNVTKYWDVSIPAQARDFLKNIRFGPQGSKVEFIQLADGTHVPIDQATDEEITGLAKVFMEAMQKRQSAAKPPKLKFHPHALFNQPK